MSASPGPAEPRFPDYDLAPDVLEALARMGIVRPTPIQQKVIPPILQGKDVIGKAETGTGKTIGFGGPLVGKIDTTRVAVQALVITPTRELAQQVAGVLEQLGEGRNLKVALVVGGVHASEQVVKLRAGSQVVVGTPGRVLDFLGDRTLSLVWSETVVVDEADRLFDMGFIDDLRKILDHLPSERQTLVFSATIPPGIKELMEKYMKDPETYSTAKGLSTVSEIRQVYREVEFNRKFDELKKILDANPDDTCIIFINTRHQAKDLDRMLWGHNYPAGALHGDHDQEKRFKTLESFRNRDIRILVATDVASRGLDIDDVGMVINYEVPVDTDSYVHRIGRTGRASKTGLAITLVARKEMTGWNRITKATKFKIEREDAATGRRGRPRGGAAARGEGARGERSRGGSQRGGRRRGGRGRGGSRSDRTAAAPGESSRSPAEAESSAGSERGAGRPESSAPRGGKKSRSRRGKPPRSPDRREGGGSSRRSRESQAARVEHVESVDLFDVSMKDFLDVSRPIDDFVAEQAAREPAGSSRDDRDSAPSPPRGDRGARQEQADAGTAPEKAGPAASRTPRRRRRRRRGEGEGEGEARKEGATAKESAGGGETAPGGSGEAAGEGKRRRRRRRGGRRRSPDAAAEPSSESPVSTEEAS